uniref:Uncharacterized protein AlNc14C36G3209 n=1 Tax=Albugo laibachii Nc14 TaxID=890382 RepID=F0W8T5_9STRA|nr:conserved hypothetical protein [Albugo laibachii Nc14]|eukprot:CCA17544.1 conserved hypothetical protein [Albugo laibachii Nc14]
MTFPNRFNYKFVLHHQRHERSNYKRQLASRDRITIQLGDFDLETAGDCKKSQVDPSQAIMDHNTPSPCVPDLRDNDDPISPFSLFGDETDASCSLDETLSCKNSDENCQLFLMSANGSNSEVNALVGRHFLLPFIRKLQWMSMNPSCLFGVLFQVAVEAWGYRLPSKVSKSQSNAQRPKQFVTLESVARKYQNRHLNSICLSLLESLKNERSNPSASIDAKAGHMMKVTALYYWNLWQSIVALCIDAVRRIQRVMSEIQKASIKTLDKRRVASISPMFENKSSDKVAHHMLGSEDDFPFSLGMGKRPRLARQSNEFMRGWFLAHKANPYPNAAERASIAERTGLSEQQVRNWFANMRKRHWKPSTIPNKRPRCFVDVVMRKNGL